MNAALPWVSSKNAGGVSSGYAWYWSSVRITEPTWTLDHARGGTPARRRRRFRDTPVTSSLTPSDHVVLIHDVVPDVCDVDAS